MARHPLSLISAWRSLIGHRALLITMLKREIAARYRGSVLGMFWSVFQPLFMLGLYSFVFALGFKARWSEGDGSVSSYVLVLFAGLLVFNFFAECFNRAPTLILGNANFVKKVVFPLETLSVISVAAAFFQFFINLGVWIVFYLFLQGAPHATLLLLPVVILPVGIFALGFSWFLSALGVYLRDTVQVVGLLSSLLMFVSPVFYSIDQLPERFRTLLWLNPITFGVVQAREVLLWGRGPDWGFYMIYVASSLLFAQVSFAWFQKVRKGFADVL